MPPFVRVSIPAVQVRLLDERDRGGVEVLFCRYFREESFFRKNNFQNNAVGRKSCKIFFSSYEATKLDGDTLALA